MDDIGEWVPDESDPELEFVRDRIEHLRVEFEKGDRYALLGAIRACAGYGLPLPPWAAEAYIVAFDRVHRLEERSWDIAFGKPLPKSANAKKERELRDGFAVKVWTRVKEILAAEPGTPIDDVLFARVGEEFHIGKSGVKDHYYGYEERRAKYLADWYASE